MNTLKLICLIFVAAVLILLFAYPKNDKKKTIKRALLGILVLAVVFAGYMGIQRIRALEDSQQLMLSSTSSRLADNLVICINNIDGYLEDGDAINALYIYNAASFLSDEWNYSRLYINYYASDRKNYEHRNTLSYEDITIDLNELTLSYDAASNIAKGFYCLEVAMTRFIREGKTPSNSPKSKNI